MITAAGKKIIEWFALFMSSVIGHIHADFYYIKPTISIKKKDYFHDNLKFSQNILRPGDT